MGAFLVSGEAKPYSKAQQLARGERRYRRKVASPKSWQRIIDAKRGDCRCLALGECGGQLQFHHLWPRDLHGPDVEDNIVPLCAYHHALVTLMHEQTCRAMLGNLTDAEYAFVTTEAGEQIWERAYGLVYTR